MVSNPLLIAHRGGAAEAPENTLAAFRYSLSLGIRWFELDVQMSKDGVPVVIHDETVDRTTNGSGPVRSLVFEELRRLDAGSWFGPRYEGEVIPTLPEALELCATERAGVLVELKSPHLYPGILEKVVGLVSEMRAKGAHNIWCISFDHPAISRMRELDAALPLGYLFLPQVESFATPDETVQAVLPFYLTAAQPPEQIQEAHRLGKQVFVWTVNDDATMRHMAELGVDAIVSDRPSLLREVFGGVSG